MLDQRGKLHERAGLSRLRFHPAEPDVPLQHRASLADETEGWSHDRDPTFEVHAPGISVTNKSHCSSDTFLF